MREKLNFDEKFTKNGVIFGKITKKSFNFRSLML